MKILCVIASPYTSSPKFTSLYPTDTSIIAMGHSMGGVVATSLLRIAFIYCRNPAALATANIPILSLCGGAMDLMVPSKWCVLPDAANTGVYRRTVFSSALEVKGAGQVSSTRL